MQCRATGVKVNHVQMTNIDQGKTLPLASQKYEKSSNKHAWWGLFYVFMKELHYFWMNPILTVEDIVYIDW